MEKYKINKLSGLTSLPIHIHLRPAVAPKPFS